MIVTDEWVEQAAIVAGRWLDEASELDRAWMRHWYVEQGRDALSVQLMLRRRVSLELIQEPLTTARRQLSRLPADERRLQLLCCIADAIRGLRLLQELSSAGIGGRLSKELLLRQAAQTAAEVEHGVLSPWPSCWPDPLLPDDEDDE